MRNAVKAQVIVLVNTFMLLVASFGVEVSDKQQLAIGGFVNAALSLWVLVTDKGPAPAPPA
jgi:hypothetical protein